MVKKNKAMIIKNDKENKRLEIPLNIGGKEDIHYLTI